MSRKRMTPKDAVDPAEQELQRRIRKRHIDLFPEEYDHMFDSISEARARRQGMSPMDKEQLDATNRRRVAMGFAPLSASGHATSSETFDHVAQQMRAGEEVVLPGVEEATRSAAARPAPAPTQLGREIAAALESDAFLGRSDDRNAPDVIAFRLLGILFERIPQGATERLFDIHIRDILPGQSDAAYRRLHRVAMNEWAEAYGC